MTGKMLIDGKLVGAADGSAKVSANPYNGEALGTYPCACREDVEQALDAAMRGQKTWAAMSFNQRAAVLLRAADIFDRHEEELTELQCREMGKPIGMCRDEYAEVPALLRSFVAAGMHQLGQVFPNKNAAGELGDVAFTTVEPLGVVVCVGPFNFPLSTMTFKVAPALTMGNAVIIKAPSDCPLCILRYAELLHAAGFPDGVVQAVSGSGGTVGDWLIDNDRISAVGLTGSTEVGSHVMQLAGKRFVRVLLELGGNDALIITEDADIDDAAAQSMRRSANAGQICCLSKRFLVHNSVIDEYLSKLTEQISKLRFGDPLDPNTDMSCLVSERAAVHVEAQVNHTIAQGAALICGGRRRGAFMEPTVLRCTRDMDVAKDLEVFGPVWSVIGFDSDDEAVEIANSSIYGLNGGVIAGRLERGIKIASRIQSGTVVANGDGLFRRDIHCFGGYKHSGIGREGVQDLLAEYSQRKTIVIRGV